MKPYRITLHCSATENNKEVRAGKIKLWHLGKDPPWSDIGYHLCIQPSGEVEKYPGVGRPLNVQGAGVAGDNAGNIHICMIGLDQWTRQAFDSLRSELDAILQTYDIRLDQIYGHYEFESAKKQGKTCPNMRISDVVLWYVQHDIRFIEKYLIEYTGVSGWRQKNETKGKKMTPGQAMLAVFKDLGFWNGVVKSVVLPPVKALVASTDNKWDDSLLAMGEGFIDKLLPVKKAE